MIAEAPLLPVVQLETYDAGVWTPWLAAANSVVITRGGKRSVASSTVDVGTLTAILVNTGDPLAAGILRPNLPVRIGSTSSPIFTGRILDIDTSYKLDKKTGKITTYVALSATDSVAAHVNTTVYGAVAAGAVGYETWALRIIRLAASATTTVSAPADDSPIVRYGI